MLFEIPALNGTTVAFVIDDRICVQLNSRFCMCEMWMHFAPKQLFIQLDLEATVDGAEGFALVRRFYQSLQGDKTMKMRLIMYSLVPACFAVGAVFAQDSPIGDSEVKAKSATEAAVQDSAQTKAEASADAASQSNADQQKSKAGAESNTKASAKAKPQAEQQTQPEIDVGQESTAKAEAKKAVKKTEDEAQQQADMGEKKARKGAEDTAQATNAAKSSTSDIPPVPMSEREAADKRSSSEGSESTGQAKQEKMDETVPENRRRRRMASGDIDAGGNVNQLGLWLNEDVSTGIVVGRMAPDSPFTMAGLQPGDRIIRFNNRRYMNRSEFRDDLRNWTLQGPVPVTFVRDGRQYYGTVPMTAWSQNQSRTYDSTAPETAQNRSESRDQPQPYTASRPIYDDSYHPTPPVGGAACCPTVSAPRAIVDPCCGVPDMYDPCQHRWRRFRMFRRPVSRCR